MKIVDNERGLHQIGKKLAGGWEILESVKAK